MSWVYVPGLAGLNSESASPCPKRAASLTWRGKPLQPRVLSREWKAGNFIRRLSGLTLPLSTLNHGVEQWIASLAATRASPTALQDSAKVKPTTGSLPIKSFGLPRSAGLIVSSAKTCRGTRTDSSQCWSRHWKDWATALRREYSARPKWGPAIDVSGSFSWPTWSTPRVATGAYTRDQGQKGAERLSLEGEAAQWRTPSDISRRGGSQPPAKRQQGNHTVNLEDQAEHWATPQARDHFPAHSPERIAKLKAKGHGMRNLNDEAEHWPTPASRDHKGANSTDHVTTNGTGRMHMGQLPNYVAHAFHSSPPDQAIPFGLTSSQTRRLWLLLCLPLMHSGPSGFAGLRRAVNRISKPSLNPRFVEWLVGWPAGWTDLEQPETGLSHWLQRSRGALLTLRSEPMPEAGDQRGLFD